MLNLKRHVSGKFKIISFHIEEHYFLPSGRKAICNKLIFKLLIAILFLGSWNNAKADGWSFSTQEHVSGSECGSMTYTLPYSTLNIPTKSQCEQVRQAILSIKVSAGFCTAYFTCSECTGSDILSGTGSGQEGGAVSISGLDQGNPFFSANNSTAIEDWITQYQQRVSSMTMRNQANAPSGGAEVPLSGDVNLDNAYQNYSNNPDYLDASVVDLRDASRDHTPTVQLLRTDADVAMENKWYEENGFNNMEHMSAQNEIVENEKAEETSNSNSSYAQDAYLYAIGKIPGGELPSEVGSFMLAIEDKSINNLRNGADAIMGTGPSDKVLDVQGVVYQASTQYVKDKAKDLGMGLLVKGGKLDDALDAGGDASFMKKTAEWLMGGK